MPGSFCEDERHDVMIGKIGYVSQCMCSNAENVEHTLQFMVVKSPLL